MSLTKLQREQVWKKYGGRCAYCGEPIELKDMQADHIKPIFRGWDDQLKAHLPEGHLGDNSIENFNPACRACNFRKGTSDIEGFREALEHGLDCCRRDFTYRMMVRYGLVVEQPKKVQFYFEKFNQKEIIL